MIVAFLFPVHDHTKALFTLSALAFQDHTFRTRPDIRLQGHMVHKTGTAAAREQLAELALRGGAEWFLWADADQAFPPDSLLRLLAHNEPFVGVNQRKRQETVESSARRLVNGKLVGIEPKQEGLEPVDLLGFGVTLTSAEIFRKLPRPWFQSGPHGEDGYFCTQAIKAGFTPMVDHALSREVGHVAETVLKF